MTDAAPLRAFHGDPAIKRKYLARILAHAKADEIVQGIGYEHNGTVRGCAVGCTLDVYDHARYPIELGLPEWIGHLEDCIHEGLPSCAPSRQGLMSSRCVGNSQSCAWNDCCRH